MEFSTKLNSEKWLKEILDGQGCNSSESCHDCMISKLWLKKNPGKGRWNCTSSNAIEMAKILKLEWIKEILK